MTTTLTPSPKQKFFDNNGAPLNKGKLFIYSGGTTTKATTWQDSAGSVTNTNPIILDYRGECNLWISPNVSYKYVLAPSTDTDPPTNPIYTVDNIVNSQLITLYGGVDTGIANAYVLNFTANFSALTDGIIFYWYPAHANSSSSTLNVNGLGVTPLLNTDGTALVFGTIVANQIIGVIFRSGNWYILAPQSISGTYTGTFTGMTAVITGTVRYRIINNVCTIYSNSFINGTSNSTAMQLTGSPTTLVPTVDKTVICTVINNGQVITVSATISSTTGNITFSPLQVSGAYIASGGLFTAAGQKGVDTGFTMTFPLI